MIAARFITFGAMALAGACCAQSEASLQRLRQRYSDDQIAEIRQNARYKYEGLLLFYGSSFEVEDHDEFRAAEESEVLAIDIHAHDQVRSITESVIVDDPILQRRIKLLSRSAFEQLLLDHLGPEDRAAYLDYKSQSAGEALKRP